MELIDQKPLEELKAMDEGQGIFLKDILKLFISESEKILTEISTHTNSGDYELMSNSAHKLKGSSMSVGAAGLGEICGRFEKKPDFKNDDDKKNMLEDLNNIFTETRSEFNKIISGS